VMEAFKKHETAIEDAKCEVRKLAAEEHHSWKILKEEDGVTIKKAEKKGVSVPVFKATGTIDVPTKTFFEEILTDKSGRRKEWNPSYATSQKLEEYQEDGRHFELYTDSVNGALGGLISGRDFVNIRDFEEKDGCYLFWLVSVEDERVPPSDDFVRGRMFPSGYVIEPLGPNKSRVSWITHADIGGKVPSFMVAKGMVGEILETFRRWRAMFETD